MVLSILKILLSVYLVICVLLYFYQENLIFYPQKLPKNFRFSFNRPFSEISVRTVDDIVLSALLFKTNNPKGVIFYLHGNAGSLLSWGEVAEIYTAFGYDVFMLDYRGYGKSEGRITSEKQFYQDVQAAYNQLRTIYDQNTIIVLGYSIGTGPAAKIAAENHPKHLILQAPYYSLTDMMRHLYPIIPTFLLKYKFNTYKFIQNCTMPVTIFHGDSDEVIYYGSAVKLKSLMKQSDTLITLYGEGHNGMSYNPQYLSELKKILEKIESKD